MKKKRSNGRKNGAGAPASKERFLQHRGIFCVGNLVCAYGTDYLAYNLHMIILAFFTVWVLRIQGVQ
ncbi:MULTISPECIES: hypothetical protein [unclassified Bilifractor]|uniref:hypothetical protein n=1 Tax=unclassified Bilifractor TaxID=2815795 RepID=UPI003F939EE8